MPKLVVQVPPKIENLDIMKSKPLKSERDKKMKDESPAPKKKYVKPAAPEIKIQQDEDECMSPDVQRKLPPLHGSASPNFTPMDSKHHHKRLDDMKTPNIKFQSYPKDHGTDVKPLAPSDYIKLKQQQSQEIIWPSQSRSKKVKPS